MATIDASPELKQILSHYALGDLVGYERDARGTVNTSYAIECSAGGEIKRYFLRRYKAGIKEEELLCEHSLLNHLLEKNFTLVPRVYATREGGTYVRAGGDGPIFYAIFDFLEGEDKYTWIDPHCDAVEIASAAATLAGYHQAVAGWTPLGLRQEPKIIDLLPTLPGLIERLLAHSRNTEFDDCLADHHSLIIRHLQRVLEALHQPQYRSLPELMIHCDYHPGNLKFANGRVVAMFDFDWSKVDARCFDLGLTLVYFFSSWAAEDNGALDLAGLALFLSSYQGALLAPGGAGGLSLLEQAALPELIAAGNLYVMNWTLLDYDRKPAEVQEYLGYLRHHIGMISWLDERRNQLRLEQAINLACA